MSGSVNRNQCKQCKQSKQCKQCKQSKQFSGATSISDGILFYSNDRQLKSTLKSLLKKKRSAAEFELRVTQILQISKVAKFANSFISPKNTYCWGCLETKRDGNDLNEAHLTWGQGSLRPADIRLKCFFFLRSHSKLSSHRGWPGQHWWALRKARGTVHQLLTNKWLWRVPYLIVGLPDYHEYHVIKITEKCTNVVGHTWLSPVSHHQDNRNMPMLLLIPEASVAGEAVILQLSLLIMTIIRSCSICFPSIVCCH